MGLLDFQDEVDDFAFANFDSCFSPTSAITQSTPAQTPQTPSTEIKHDSATSYFPISSSKYHFAGASMESVSTNASSSSSSSTSSTSSSSPRKSRKSRSLLPPSSTRRNRSKSFDVFGEDEELQAAEPSIRFCDICLKDCHTHR